MNKIADQKQNRRRSQRCRARTTVKVQCRKDSHGLGANLALRVLDISDSGICLIVTQPLEAMAELEILINGYGMKDVIKRLANIRWRVDLESGQCCVGVVFQKSLAYRDWQTLIAPN
jgi:PilZ domain